MRIVGRWRWFAGSNDAVCDPFSFCTHLLSFLSRRQSRKASSDLAGFAFRIRVPRDHSTGGNHCYRGFTSNLTHLLENTSCTFLLCHVSAELFLHWYVIMGIRYIQSYKLQHYELVFRECESVQDVCNLGCRDGHHFMLKRFHCLHLRLCPGEVFQNVDHLFTGEISMNLLDCFNPLICQNTLSYFIQNDVKRFLIHLKELLSHKVVNLKLASRLLI